MLMLVLYLLSAILSGLLMFAPLTYGTPTASLTTSPTASRTVAIGSFAVNVSSTKFDVMVVVVVCV